MTYDTSDEESDEDDTQKEDVVHNAPMKVPATLPNEDINDFPGVDNLEHVNGNIGTVPRRTYQAAIRSRVSTRQLALEGQQDPDLVEEIRNFSQIYTPVVSRDNSLDHLEDSIHLQDSPPDFSYEQSTLLSLEEETLPT